MMISSSAQKVSVRNVCLALVMLLASKMTSAVPCIPQTLDNYLTPGFSCGVARTGPDTYQWTFFDFEFSERDNLSEPEHIMVRPFGGTARAGLQFDLLERNQIGLHQILWLYVDYTVQIAAAGIRTTRLDTTNLLAGPPDGFALINQNVCPGALFIDENGVPTCPVFAYQNQAYYAADSNETQFSEVSSFTQAFLIDVDSSVFLRGGDEFPGGARLDSWSHRFNTASEPSIFALFALGLAGLRLCVKYRFG